MRVLVVNAGSSSLKLRIVEPDGSVAGRADLGPGPDGREVGDALRGLPAPDAIGHRIVHGGSEFTGPVRLDPSVVQRLQALTDLAPLHQPKSLAALAAVSAALPHLPAVACFDTAFHSTIAEEVATYALPEQWRQRYAVRKYGFHGLSHAYAARRTAELLGRSDDGFRVVTCHLGAGASLAAVRGGRSVDTTMGFTPLDGLVMATRSGSVDPGLVLWLEQHAGLSPDELSEALERRAGLLGLTGTADMREVVDRANQGEHRAGLGLAVYLHRFRAGVAAMTAALGGLDALVFTGGVGENSPDVRANAIAGLEWLGLSVDEERNATAVPDVDITGSSAAVPCIVVAAREDIEIARETREVFSA